MFMVLPQFELTFEADNEPLTLIGTDDEILTVMKVLLRSEVAYGAISVKSRSPVGVQEVTED